MADLFHTRLAFQCPPLSATRKMALVGSCVDCPYKNLDVRTKNLDDRTKIWMSVQKSGCPYKNMDVRTKRNVRMKLDVRTNLEDRTKSGCPYNFIFVRTNWWLYLYKI